MWMASTNATGAAGHMHTLPSSEPKWYRETARAAKAMKYAASSLR